MGFYIESSDRPLQSYNAGEQIKVGTLVVAEGDGTVSLADADTHSRFDGVAASPRRAEYIADEIDDPTDFTYKVDTSDERYGGLTTDGPHLVPYGGGGDDDLIKVRTITDTGTSTAPNVTDQDVVGFVDTSVGDAPDDAGRIVEEDYSNGAKTFNESNNNFVAIGRAYKPKEGEGDDYDDIVRVEVGV
jgi:hypothetical protein